MKWASEVSVVRAFIEELVRYVSLSSSNDVVQSQLWMYFQYRHRKPRPEEIEKLNRRREQNRRAAQKFRKKKKERGKVLIEESQRLECDNNSLRSEISKLNRERDELLQILSEHVQLCHQHEITSGTPPPP